MQSKHFSFSSFKCLRQITDQFWIREFWTRLSLIGFRQFGESIRDCIIHSVLYSVWTIFIDEHGELANAAKNGMQENRKMAI